MTKEQKQLMDAIWDDCKKKTNTLRQQYQMAMDEYAKKLTQPKVDFYCHDECVRNAAEDYETPNVKLNAKSVKNIKQYILNQYTNEIIKTRNRTTWTSFKLCSNVRQNRRRNCWICNA